MSSESWMSVDIKEEEIVVIGACTSRGFHRARDPTEDDPKPACHAETKPSARWRYKPYWTIKGWRKPCERRKCFGEDE